MKSFLITLFLILPVSVLGAPTISSVSGDFSTGQQITINGSNFGPNGPNIVLFDDFSGSIPNSVHPTQAIIGKWAAAGCVGFADSALSNGKGARCIDQGKLTSTVIFPTTQEVFMSSIAYVPDNYKFPSADVEETFPDVSSLKHFWLMYGSNGYSSSTAPDMYGPAWTGAKFYRVTSNDTVQSSFDRNGDVSFTWGTPVRWTIWAKGNGTSTVGTNGMFQSISSASHNIQSYKDYKPWFKDEHTVKGWDRANFIGYARTGTDYTKSLHNWVIDDVYVATGKNAAARIEIGDNANYASCRKLALLTPANWSDNQIIATVRSGGFSSNSNAYIFIIDANNNVSNGYPISLGDIVLNQKIEPAQNLRLH